MSTWIQRSMSAPSFELEGLVKGQGFALSIGGVLFGTIGCDPNDIDGQGSPAPGPVGSVLVRNDLSLSDGTPQGSGQMTGPLIFVKTPDGLWYSQ